LPEARAGWGRPEKCLGSLPAKARVGWGLPARYPGIPHEGAGGVGEAGRSVWYPLRRRGRGGGCRRGIRVSLMKAWVGRGCRQKRMGIAYRRRRG